MTSKNSEPDEQYIHAAEQCHVLLESISEFFSSDLLSIDEDEIAMEHVERITAFKDRLHAVLASPIK